MCIGVDDNGASASQLGGRKGMGLKVIKEELRCSRQIWD
jgi:hypothetical protein